MSQNRPIADSDHFINWSVFKTVSLYATFAALWILFSDQLVIFNTRDPQEIALISTIKGLFFVVITSLLLAYMMRRFFNQLASVTEALRVNEERWKLALEGAGDGVWDWNIKTGEVIFSHRWKEMLGYTESEIGDNFDEWKRRVHPDDIAAAQASIQSYFNGETPNYSIEHRLQCKDGSWKWILARGMIVSRSAEGQPQRMIGTHIDITERKKVKEALQVSDRNYQTLFNEMLDGFAQHQIICNTAGQPVDYRFMRVNPAFTRMTGLTEEAIIGRTVLEIMPGTEPHWIETYGKVALTGEPAQFENYSAELNKHFQVTAFQPVAGQFACIFTDITERKNTEADLRIAAAAFDSRESMIITDAHSVIQRINRAFTENTGYRAEEVIGKTPAILKSSRHDAEFFRSMWESINRMGGWQGEIWDKRKNGEEYMKWLTISAVKNDTGDVTHYIGVQHDITERKLAEEKIHKLAFFDHLTGLPNRTLLLDRLKQAMTSNARSSHYGALLMIDLDNFKMLNDTLGHDMGDLLLKQVAQRLISCVRAEDTVARLGGDEFMVILANLGKDATESASRVDLVAEKILAELNQNYHLNEVIYHCTPSIGASLFQGQQAEIDILLKQADLAMYRAKDAGRNAIRFFDPDMEQVVMKRAALEKDLRAALQQEQFVLYYQAQVAGGQLTGAEVLIRWPHPQRGLVSPFEFIPIAEENGLILPIGLWVLEAACKQLAIWAKQPAFAHLTIAVNVSAQQFRQDDFANHVLNILKATGADPQRLKLELTESLLVSNVDEVIEKMFALKAKGVGFSLDDFGTGYSSLSYLKRLPLDHLKIDQSFVRDVLSDPNDASIAKTIIALAASLGIGVIAEGVENALQRDFLAQAGCHAYQGYFFGRPVPIAEFEHYAQQSSNPAEPSPSGTIPAEKT